MSPEAQAWLDHSAAGFLKRAGLKTGQTVLDFGCNKGNYTRAAAEVVGPLGKVYALDKDADAVEDICPASKRKKLDNVECLQVAEDAPVPLPACSVDVALLYDVLHRGYFPEARQRLAILRNVYAVLKSGGLLSLYPTHLRKYAISFDQIVREVKSAGFRLRSEARRRLVHDGNLVRGRVFSFTKNGGCAEQNPKSTRRRSQQAGGSLQGAAALLFGGHSPATS